MGEWGTWKSAHEGRLYARACSRAYKDLKAEFPLEWVILVEACKTQVRMEEGVRTLNALLRRRAYGRAGNALRKSHPQAYLDHAHKRLEEVRKEDRESRA